MSLLSDIWESIKEFFSGVVNFIKKIIRGVLNFLRDIVSWFKALCLDPAKDTPFIMRGDKLKELIDNAPVYDAGIFSENSIVKGVYDKETNEVSKYEIVESDGLDNETKNTLSKGKDGLVVLK